MGYKRQHKDPLAYICPESSISLKQQDKILRERAGSGDWCGCGCCIRKRQRNEGQEFHSPPFLIFYLQLLPKESSNNLMGFFLNSAQLKFVGNTNILILTFLFICLVIILLQQLQPPMFLLCYHGICHVLVWLYIEVKFIFQKYSIVTVLLLMMHNILALLRSIFELFKQPRLLSILRIHVWT